MGKIEEGERNSWNLETKVSAHLELHNFFVFHLFKKFKVLTSMIGEETLSSTPQSYHSIAEFFLLAATYELGLALGRLSGIDAPSVVPEVFFFFAHRAVGSQ